MLKTVFSWKLFPTILDKKIQMLTRVIQYIGLSAITLFGGPVKAQRAGAGDENILPLVAIIGTFVLLAIYKQQHGTNSEIEEILNAAKKGKSDYCLCV